MNARDSSSPPAALPSLRILFVDDEPCIRHIFGEVLRSDGHTVGLAADGHAALAKFREEPWDVVITDRAMPGMDGEALARQIKRMDLHVPIILITGFAPKAYDPQLIDEVLMKPFTRQNIYDVIARSFAHRQQAEAAEMKRAAA